MLFMHFALLLMLILWLSFIISRYSIHLFWILSILYFIGLNLIFYFVICNRSISFFLVLLVSNILLIFLIFADVWLTFLFWIGLFLIWSVSWQWNYLFWLFFWIFWGRNFLLHFLFWLTRFFNHLSFQLIHIFADLIDSSSIFSLS